MKSSLKERLRIDNKLSKILQENFRKLMWKKNLRKGDCVLIHNDDGVASNFIWIQINKELDEDLYEGYAIHRLTIRNKYGVRLPEIEYFHYDDIILWCESEKHIFIAEEIAVDKLLRFRTIHINL